ncbi:hypothetical protein Tamer19_17540 [Cupriavidus sp. TA19]|uniref:hypothetical protein n=1 Tax=Cupriavidus sp. TA19 TaxID=701108 RepID=UPI002729470B|nr:hypothetical protein [Cupriavidus sp. TA19]GLC92346.1 hypothetical protein Tamer19_17540 [Cupriavidus sp. TA19]
MKKTIALAGLALLAAQGCATKNYGTQSPLTDFERQTLTCREIQVEEAKVQGFRAKIEGQSVRLDARDFVPWNFGIGNSLSYSEAVESADRRAQQLHAAAIEKGCVATKSHPPLEPVVSSHR